MFLILHVLQQRCHFQTKVPVYIELILHITLISQKQLCMMSQPFQTQRICCTSATQKVASIFKHKAFMLGRSGLNRSALSSIAHCFCGCCCLVKGPIHQDRETFLPVPAGDVPPHQTHQSLFLWSSPSLPLSDYTKNLECSAVFGEMQQYSVSLTAPREHSMTH